MNFRLATTARSVRQNLMLALGLAFLLLTGLQWYVTDAFLTKQLHAVESQNAFGTLQRVEQAIEAASAELTDTVRDWAQWDESYHFALGEPTNFGIDNLNRGTFQRLRLGLLMMIGADGKVLYAQMLNDRTGELLDVPPSFIRAALSDLSSSNSKRTGLLYDKSGTYLMSSQPLTNGSLTATPQGRLIMGRSINDLAPQIGRLSGVEVSQEPWRDVAAAAAADNDDSSRVLNHSALLLSHDRIDGYLPLIDLAGTPVGLLHARMDRPLHATLHKVSTWLLFGTFVVGVSFGLAGIVVVQWRVVAPIERMAAAVAHVGKDETGAARIDEMQEAAEFVSLSRAINVMLEQLQQQQVMRTDRDAAVEANRLKSEFLATMSHEIRTPMNGVLGMCELLQRTHLDSRQRHLADTVLRSARSLLDILNDILDFSKIESGKLQLEPETFSPADLIGTVSAPFVSAAQTKGVELQTRVDSQVPGVLIGDAVRLRQVLNNLVGNAVKFTASGRIMVTCDIEQTDTQHVWLRVTVEDTGIGIAKDAQKYVFDAFSQAESNTTRRYGGTGLGLAIVSRLVTLMEGSVGLQSEPGAGSKFWFTAKLQRAAAETMPSAADAAMLTGLRFAARQAPHVLLAEDHPVNREVLTEMLEVFGCKVTAVENGALALAQASANSFAMIIMDCQMPVMDGQTAATQLRKLETASARGRAHIVALTADATTANMQRCFEAGMDDVVTKPVSHKRLRELVQQAIQFQQAAVA